MKKIISIALIVTILFAVSCNSGTEKTTEEDQTTEDQVSESYNTSETTNTTTTDELVLTNFNQSMSKDLDYEGEIVLGKSWNDANGENVMLFTEKNIEHSDSRSRYLYAYHYAGSGSNMKLLRKIQDFEEKCDISLEATFQLNTISITDLNNNALAEITFMYCLGCIGDASPVPLKLIMLENGDKYAIRGTTLVDLDKIYGGGGKLGGEKKVDASFNNAPKEFLDFANEQWEAEKLH